MMRGWISSMPVPVRDADGPASDFRLLLVSYHFPPGQAVGALRWQKMVRYAAERGWGVDVITLAPESLGDADRERLAELPADVRVFGVPAPDPALDRAEATLGRLVRHLRRARGGGRPEAAGPAPAAAPPRPDSFSSEQMRHGPRTRRDLLRAYYAWREFARDGRWAASAAALAERLIRPGVHRAVVTCGPPHMVHEAGRRISARAGLPLVMDLRDPWSMVQRLPESIASPVWLGLAARYERRAMEAASLVVANTEALRAALGRLYPRSAERIVTVMNGYDDEPVPPSAPGRRFILAYAGTIYLDRDPGPLFRAAARVVRELRLTPDDLGIELMGLVHGLNGVSVEEMARAVGLEGFLRVHASRPRGEAMRFLAQASMLVSLPQDSDMAIPSKIFEYMKFQAWLLALAEPGSATERLLRGSDADVVAPADEAEIAARIARRYQEHRSGRTAPRLAREARFSRREQARVLFAALEQTLGVSPRPTRAGAVPLPAVAQ